MKYDKKPFIILMFYMLSMLTICIFSVMTLSRAKNYVGTSDIQSDNTYVAHTQLVYITMTEENTSVDNNTTLITERSYWKVCEYEGRIGIFLEDGTLYDILDVYVKTLPEADRRMLGEGIIIESEEALRSIIEDYTA